MKQNWKNRTMWTGDNLPILRGMNSETVDLIYLDPPFNSNRDYSAPIGSEAAGAAFKDTWTLEDVDEAWHGEVAEQNPAVYSIIGAAREAHGKGMQSYLMYDGRPAAGDAPGPESLRARIYLHCDPDGQPLPETAYGRSIRCRGTFGVRSRGDAPMQKDWTFKGYPKQR